MTPPHVDPSQIYRTPSERFDFLPGFPYKAHFSTWGNLRYAYLDVEGPIVDLKTGAQVSENILDSTVTSRVQTETVLCLHGEPTWSYLYRKMIPGFLHDVSPRGNRPESVRYVKRRIVVPDLIGFGQSDKPIKDEFYTFDMHREWLLYFVTKHIVEEPRTSEGGRVTLVVQDWGGILGLILPNTFPTLFSHLIVMNTGLGLGKTPSEGWLNFRDFIKRSPDVDVGSLLGRGTPLTQQEVEAYRAPFEGLKTKAGVRRFPELVPVHPSMRGVPDSYAALAYFTSLPPVSFTSNSLAIPATPQSQGTDSTKGLGAPLSVFVVVGKSDPVLGEPVMKALSVKLFGQSTGYHWHVIPDGGHFVQEWSTHVPALADRAWSKPPSNDREIVRYDDKEATWIAPSTTTTSSHSRL